MSVVQPEWHYISGGTQQGPVSVGHLKQLAATGQLQPGDMIWKQGMATWVAASTIQGLFPASGAAPPPPPPPPDAEKPFPSERGGPDGPPRSASRGRGRAPLQDVPKTYGQQASDPHVRFSCPFCKSSAGPYARSKISQAGWVVFIIMLITCIGWLFLWIPLIFMKEEHRFCRHCNMQLS